MKNFIKKSFAKPYLIIPLFALIVGAVTFVAYGEIGNPPIVPSALKSSISSTSVAANGNVSLSFIKSGKIEDVLVKEGEQVTTGQVLAKLSAPDMAGLLSQAQGALAQSQANLKKIKAGLGSSVDKSNLSLIQTQTALVNTIKDSYTKADDALRNKIYSLFTDPIRYGATLSFSTDSFLREDIEKGKDTASDSLDAWSRSLNTISPTGSDLESQYTSALSNLNLIKSLLDKCATAVNALNAQNTNISQSQIDVWKLNISTARTNINTAISALTTSYDQLKTASLSSQISAKDTLIEQASIEQAEAQVASAEGAYQIALANYQNTLILAPIDGVVTFIDPDLKVGQAAFANKSVISLSKK